MNYRGKTGVEIKTGFLFLAFFLYFCETTIVIDGKEHKRPWGTHFFPLYPGEHEISVYFIYFWAETGRNTVKVTVKDSQAKRVSFWMPPYMLTSGWMEVEDI